MTQPVLTALTYNLKYASDHPPHAWPARRGLVAELLREQRADVVATQEGLYGQLRDVAADTGYDWVGLGRDGGSAGEHCAILYDRAVLDPESFDHFWLSATPAWVGSRTPWWGNRDVRIATWVRFRVRATGGALVWLNTHLDNNSGVARRRGAMLIARRLRRFDRTVPLVVSGDFNCAPTDDPHRILIERAGLADAWDVSSAPPPVTGTYGGWAAPAADGGRIDWVLVRGPLSVLDAGICDYHRADLGADGWPSDHVAVRVSLALPPGPVGANGS
ncbi:MAG: endonuclease/exonuclease/phosphatase family protein [Mycobacteriales bacterium]|nr:MAG: endonuclease [Pseudonocardiales bacterium]